MSDRVLVTIEDTIARVRLNRANKHNALDMDMFKGIVAAQKQLKKVRDLRVVILSGEGEDFCSGLDVRSMMGNWRSALRLMWKWLPWLPNMAQAVSVGWRDLKVPVIAAIHGRCWGGGLQIALGADFRILQSNASISVMEGKWGLIPDMGGTLAMRDLMYRDQAMKLAMTAEIIDAEKALALGLATAISTDVEKASSELADQLLDRSPDAVAAVKRLYQKSWHNRGLVLARESASQICVLAGINQHIAVRRQKGENTPWDSV